MWKVEFDDRLKSLFNEYEKMFGCYPDTYEEIAYFAMTYDEFVGYIEKSLKQKIEIDEVVK